MFVIKLYIRSDTLQSVVLPHVVFLFNHVDKVDDSVLLINKHAIGKAETIPFLVGAN